MLLSELKARAEKATPGEWQVGVDGFPVGGFSTGNSGEDGWDYCVSTNARSDQLCDSHADAKNDAAFIAAANPAVVLELLARLDAMEKALKESWRHAAGPDEGYLHGCDCRLRVAKGIDPTLSAHGSQVPLGGRG